MNKLVILRIDDTDPDSGLEYLSDSIKDFSCSTDIEDAKVKAIYDLFVNEKGEVETEDKCRSIKNFPQKLQDYKQWRKLNFTEEEIKEWIGIGLIISEYELANALRQKNYQPNAPKIKEIITKERWQDIHPEFNYWLRKAWENKDFDKSQAQEWITAGAKLDDYEFITWLRDIKNYGLEWITNYQADYQILSKRFKYYGLCSECNQPNTGEQWCRNCNEKHSMTRFSQLTQSNNSKINEFIQKYQLKSTDKDKFLEWIPYEQFVEIEYLAEGGFGKVYKAKWMAGNIKCWNSENKQWQREKDNNKNYKMIVLKSLNNSQDNTDFLDETANHKIIDDWFNNIVPCYGLSQDPETKNYLMVMKYMPEGNLREYLSNNSRELSFKDKLNQLFHIAQGLKDIHAKNLVHRDFHSGNILKGIKKTECLITDLGLCKPADETKQEDKVFGVLPYVSPEILNSKPYTPASDIYSFGVVAYELLAGLPPYYDRSHDVNLAIEICQGLRPQFNIKLPQLLEDFIKRCWDANPANRPTAQELEKTLRGWETNTEFKKQLQVAEEYNKTLSDEIKYPDYKKKIHSGASYHSKLLPTKEITRLLQSKELSGSSEISMSGLLDNLPNTSQENQQTEQQAQILQTNQPYGTPSSSKNN